MFDTWGPFDCTLDDVDELWVNFRASETPNIESGIGIYIVASENESGELTPWYVGQTRKQNFGGRLKQHFVKERFADLQNLRLKVFLIAQAKDGKPTLSSQSSADKKYIDLLELRLIDECYSVNDRLLNKSEVSFLKSCWVAGFRGVGCHTGEAAATALAKMLRLNERKS